MEVWQCAVLGGAGGGLIELVTLYDRLGSWQQARRTPTGLLRKNPPRLAAYVDLGPFLVIGAIRIALGAATATAFGASGQVGGGYAALTVGAAAPALLAQVGSQLPVVREAVATPRGRGARSEGDAGQAAPPAADALGTAAGPVAETFGGDGSGQ
ncbi:hypothetical protein [Streptomyces hoynatensis]|uniref:Uncharacterized protein n=1 Tax=Streptomyces hoynatensis TaxID=1141874 RepID=A0A3A9YV52_9ACTN|nr:hypothetical protein [Streptomyces hoynatensis]RKN39454.1 hypothetical protein D7294_20860 [Streptomyces hoynatensis]